MLLTDHFSCTPDLTWDFAVQCGVQHGVFRLPETDDFDFTNLSHWDTITNRFLSAGITPLIVEPMPNRIHEHIKRGDALRDEAIEQVIRMFAVMDRLDIRMICFNFMAHIGWLRTNTQIPERGGAIVTGFNIDEFTPIAAHITEEDLWANYTYFLKAVIPYAEKYGIKLALHPDDPPLSRLGDVARIMTSFDNINHAVREIVPSDNLGVTYCQACFQMMGEDVYEAARKFADKIFFVHFRNAVGNKYHFRESFHDNGDLDMAGLLRQYKSCGIDVPIRVDHVPLMAGETNALPGYTALGRLYAIGYLRGILEGLDKDNADLRFC